MGKRKLVDLIERWTKYGRDQLLGRKIVDVRYMTDEEMEGHGWMGNSAIVLQLDDGTLIYPSADDEGNGPGALFGCKSGKALVFPVVSV